MNRSLNVPLGEGRRTPVVTAAMFAVTLAVTIAGPAEAGDTLATIRSRGILRCGVSEGLAGFSIKDAGGRWTGMDVDFCRAVAAVALDDPEKVAFVPVTAAERFPRLLSGDIDLVVCHATWTLKREALLDVQFAGVMYYDGQAFMVPRSAKITRIEDLKDSTICVAKGTTHQANLKECFQNRGLPYTPIVLESLADVSAAFLSGRAQAYSSDMSQLAAVRASAPGGADNYVILSELISKEPLGAVVRGDDRRWLTLVRWVLYALIEAEECGVTGRNVRSMAKTATDPAVKRFLLATDGYENALRIRPDWTVRVIESVGNYGELFERNLGPNSPLRLERGLNRLWTRGGLMYAPPIQ